MKKDKLMWLTTIICLLPIILSVILYDKLPAQVPIHFDARGEANNYAPKAVGAFGIPIFMAVINIFSHFKINNDPKKKNASTILIYVTKWTIPLMSIILMPVSLFIAMGYKLPVQIIVPAIVGVLIVACGNYLPKCKQNYTVGIKLPWTLNSEVNWNRTHHMAGYVWIASGICMIIGSWIQISSIYIILAVIIAMLLFPFVYSYSMYKKGI